MHNRTLATALSAVALVAFAAGCAGPANWPSASIPTTTDVVPNRLSGHWSGTFSQAGGTLYEAEGRVELRINDDGTFTATVTPNRGTNNLTKPSTLSGTVDDRGDRVTLRNTQGPWTWLTLVRSGNVLYGVARDPGSQQNVLLEIERTDGQG